MITRTFKIAGVAAALGIGLAGACPAEAIGPRGGIIANGTSFNGMLVPFGWLRWMSLSKLRLQPP